MLLTNSGEPQKTRHVREARRAAKSEPAIPFHRAIYRLGDRGLANRREFSVDEADIESGVVANDQVGVVDQAGDRVGGVCERLLMA
jgi:hypothetical protein